MLILKHVSLIHDINPKLNLIVITLGNVVDPNPLQVPKKIHIIVNYNRGEVWKSKAI
jgi:hypothetical protein